MLSNYHFRVLDTSVAITGPAEMLAPVVRAYGRFLVGDRFFGRAGLSSRREAPPRRPRGICHRRDPEPARSRRGGGGDCCGRHRLGRPRPGWARPGVRPPRGGRGGGGVTEGDSRRHYRSHSPRTRTALVPNFAGFRTPDSRCCTLFSRAIWPNITENTSGYPRHGRR